MYLLVVILTAISNHLSQAISEDLKQDSYYQGRKEYNQISGRVAEELAIDSTNSPLGIPMTFVVSVWNNLANKLLFINISLSADVDRG